MCLSKREEKKEEEKRKIQMRQSTVDRLVQLKASKVRSVSSLSSLSLVSLFLLFSIKLEAYPPLDTISMVGSHSPGWGRHEDISESRNNDLARASH